MTGNDDAGMTGFGSANATLDLLPTPQAEPIRVERGAIAKIKPGRGRAHKNDGYWRDQVASAVVEPPADNLDRCFRRGFGLSAL